MSSAISRYSTIEQVGGFTACEAAVDTSTADYIRFIASQCSGGAGPGVRPTVEPAPGQDGALILPAFDDEWPIVLGGEFMIKSAGDSAGYMAALDTLFAALNTALDALKSAPDALIHSGGTLQVWKNAPLETSWADGGITMGFTFGLVVDVFA